jgi:hypothetical protein
MILKIARKLFVLGCISLMLLMINQSGLASKNKTTYCPYYCDSDRDCWDGTGECNFCDHLNHTCVPHLATMNTKP